MLKKSVLLLFTLFFHQFGFGQNIDSLPKYISCLNWESFGVIPNYATHHLVFDKNAQSIITILQHDRHHTKVLLQSISLIEKTVAINAILTKIYEPKKFDVTSETFYKKGAKGEILYTQMPVSEIFYMNGLAWKIQYNVDPPSYSLDSTEISCIEKYWTDKLKYKIRRKIRP